MLHGPVSQNRFYIYSAFGRTGSTRLCHLLSPTPHTLIAPFHVDTELHTVIHSHVLDYTIPPMYIPILSTRKDKRDIVLSNLIARKTEDWVPGINKPNEIKPFSVDVDYYIALSKQILLKEEHFLNKNTNAITIYLEDSVEDIQQKLQVPIVDTSADKASISNYPPEQTIENYNELHDAYSDAFPDA